jgi:hypothetical protein
VPKSLVRRSLVFGNAQVARRPENSKLARRSRQCGAGGVTTITVDSRWKKYEKLYGTKVNPLAAAKWENKYEKKRTRHNRLRLPRQKSILLPKQNGKIKKEKKTNASPISGRVALNRRDTRLAGRSRNQRAHGARRHDIRTSVCIANRGKNRWISYTPIVWRAVLYTETRIFAPT